MYFIFEFEYPMELHCSQTLFHRLYLAFLFEYPMELHCSQTESASRVISSRFEYPMELHCSQTSKPNLRKAACNRREQCKRVQQSNVN